MDARPEYRRDDYIRLDVVARLMSTTRQAIYSARAKGKSIIPPGYRPSGGKRGPLLFKYGDVIDAIEKTKEIPG